MTKQEFINKLAPLAVADMKKTKILASLTIAQGALETGWGSSAVMMKANALFGIKATASWKGKVFSTLTKECYDGVTFTTITDLFRAYDSWEESVADHSALFTGLPRYAAVVGETDYKKACRAVHAGGYATAPNYSDTLIAIIEQNKFYEYDKQNIILLKTEDNLMSKEYEELKKEITDLKVNLNKWTNNSKIKYGYVDKNMPEWARTTITKLTKKDYLKGDETGNLQLSDDMLRLFVTLDRAEMFGK